MPDCITGTKDTGVAKIDKVSVFTKLPFSRGPVYSISAENGMLFQSSHNRKHCLLSKISFDKHLASGTDLILTLELALKLSNTAQVEAHLC